MIVIPALALVGLGTLLAIAVLGRRKDRKIEGESCPVCHAALRHHKNFVAVCDGPEAHRFDKRYIWEHR